MSLELIAWNPRKKRRKGKKARSSTKSRGSPARARKRKRKAAKHHGSAWSSQRPPITGGRTMASKKKRRKGRKGRRGRGRSFTAHTSPPASGRRRHRGGGGRGFSLRSAFSVGAIIEGTIVGASVAGSGIVTNQIVARFKPDLAANPWLMSAAQVVIGVAGQAALKMLGLGKYAGSWMTGSVAGATLNAYGAWQAQRASSSGQNAQSTISGMRGLGGAFGPLNSPGFAPSTISRNAYSAA